MSIDGAREFGDWLSGARAARGRELGPISMVKSVSSQFVGDIPGPSRVPLSASADSNPHPVDHDADGAGALSPTAEGDPSHPVAPEGFWEPENPYEDESALSDPMSASASATGIEGAGTKLLAPSTLIMDLIQPSRVTLELTKTSMPIWQNGRGGSRTKLDTHTFVIITSTPRSTIPITSAEKTNTVEEAPHTETFTDSALRSEKEEAYSSLLPRMTVLPSLGITSYANQLPIASTTGNFLGAGKIRTPTEEVMALDLSTPPDGISDPARPIYFNRDGTVTRHRQNQAGTDSRGKALNVHELLRTKDWSQTPLGPREQWPQSLKIIGQSLALKLADIWQSP